MDNYGSALSVSDWRRQLSDALVFSAAMKGPGQVAQRVQEINLNIMRKLPLTAFEAVVLGSGGAFATESSSSSFCSAQDEQFLRRSIP